MYVEIDIGDNLPFLAHLLIVSSHVSLQFPLCGLLCRGFVTVSDHN